MPADRDSPVQECVEALCQKGCKAVWSDIARLEAGHSVPEAAALSAAERDRVLCELKDVMAVYSGSCTPD